MKNTEILVIRPSSDIVMDGLAESFSVIRLFEKSDPKRWLAENGGRIRGMVSSGSFATDRALLERLPNLEIVSHFGVGYDSVDVEAAKAQGVIVTHTPTVLDDEVADTTIALILMTLRNLCAADRYVRAGEWAEKGPFPLGKYTMKGSVLGIIGLGRIGKTIATRAEVFGMQIAYTGRRKQKGQPYDYYRGVKELAAASDVLVNCAPGGEGTYQLVNGEVLAALGRDGIFVNVGRGTTVDETALINALESGGIAAAGLDVFVDEPHVPQALRSLDNVVLLPHIGSATVPTRNAMAQLVVDNLVNWFSNGAALTPVPDGVA
ncbi:MAG TPA: 2-hydroxyacid dehydrogenase [Sulfitobacter sp.]|uniref:2-hydroxyacid dehydrogenase n=1 Tax=Sulfitobacter dubius TaxID=218673 RepID=UPI000C58C7A0|nr:2-hydroxyacid dehydrogenase [Sulfitobacter sp.]HBB85614.1 2-hydroxyacid dehydrogenase [Sulfitobacter sp.]